MAVTAHELLDALPLYHQFVYALGVYWIFSRALDVGEWLIKKWRSER